MKTNSEVEPAEFLGTPQSECFEGERKNRALSECATEISTNKTSESFDAGKPVGGIEPLNISYCIINSNNKKVQIIALFPHFLE